MEKIQKNPENVTNTPYDSYDMIRENEGVFINDKTGKKSNHTNHVTNHTNHTNHTNNSNHTNHIVSILGSPKNKEDMVYYHLFDNKEATAEELSKVSDMAIGSFRNIIKDNPKIKRIRLVNKIAIYGLEDNFREQLQLRIDQAIKEKERIKQNQLDEEKRLAEQQATEEEISTLIKELIENKSIVSFKDGFLYVNLVELKEQEPFIYEKILEKSEEVIFIFNKMIKEMGIEKNAVRFENLSALPTLNIENYRSKHLGRAVCSEVRVTSISGVRPIIVSSKFECPSCGTIISVLQTEKKFKEPSRCSCGRRGNFKEISNDKNDAAIMIIEDLEPQSQIPVSKNVTCFIKDHHLSKKEIEKLAPGNNLRVFGTLKEVPIVSGSGAMLTRLDWAVEIIDIEEFDPELNSIDFDEEEIKEFKQLSSRINEQGIETLTKSYAPEVEGYQNEKSALAIQSVQKKNKPKEEKSKSHIAIIGDPGKAKSVLSKFALKTTQGSSYSSGSGVSGVGLTVSVIKEDSIGWVAKPGQLPLTRELAIIDEFNLINEEDRPKLQEAMSEAQISVNKAGISASPRVSCGILAIANPIRGVFDYNQTIVKQFNLQPQQLNRFDAIFVQRDEKSTEQDERIVDIMLKRKTNSINSEYDVKFLRKFFTYTRNLPEPKLSSEAQSFLKECYGIARKRTIEDNSIMINPRFLDSLSRLSVGYAKLRHSDIVLKKDVKVAYNILASTYLNLGVLE